jgi:hypothetical protein
MERIVRIDHVRDCDATHLNAKWREVVRRGTDSR